MVTIKLWSAPDGRTHWRPGNHLRCQLSDVASVLDSVAVLAVGVRAEY